MSSGSIGIFLLAIFIVGAMLLTVIMLTRKKGKILNKSTYQSRWMAIETSLNRHETASYSLSVLNADKLLDQALREAGFKGGTMGERMKSATDNWTNANHVWSAHKIRNKIAHEPDVQLSYEIAARSLAAFKQGLKDVGAI